MRTKSKYPLIRSKNSILASLLVCWSGQSLFSVALAETVPTFQEPRSLTRPGSLSRPVLPGNLDLDLTSTSNSVQARNTGTIVIGGHLASNGTIQGGTPFNVLPGQLITPAMSMALLQQGFSGSQHLQINSAGAASAGTAMLSASQIGGLSSLVIPKGVTIDAIGFSRSNPLSTAGNASVLGSLFALQRAPGQTAAINIGGDLNVGASGIVSTLLPSTRSVAEAYSSRNLNLNVRGDLNNAGIISSAGNLNLSVGGVLNNISAAGSSPATISAQNLNITSGSGRVFNSGLISAISAINVNTSLPSTDLIVNNIGGRILASGQINPGTGLLQAGVINLRSCPDIEKANTGIWGGVLEAVGGVNMYGKDMQAHVEQIIGPISNTGSEAHISVNSGNLDLGPQLLTGDPVYYNSNGNLAIGNVQLGAAGNIVIVASGDITINNNGGSGTFITVSGSSSNSVFIGAGLSFTATPDSSTTSFPNGDKVGIGGSLSNFSASKTGGNINSAGDPLTIQASQNGTLTVIAAANGIAGKGNISFGQGQISASNGSILVIGEGDVSSIDPNAGSNRSFETNGNITIASAVPGNLSALSFGANGTPFTAALPTVGTTTGKLSISPGAFAAIRVDGTISLQAKTGISAGNIQSDAAAITLSTETGGITTGSINANGPISVMATSKVDSGKVSVLGSVSNANATGGITIDSASGEISIFNSNFQVNVTSDGAIDIGNIAGTTKITLGGSVNNQTGINSDVNILSSTGPIMRPLSGSNGAIKAAGNLTVTVDSNNPGPEANILLDVFGGMATKFGAIKLSAPGSIELSGISSAADVEITASSISETNPGAIYLNGSVMSPSNVLLTAANISLVGSGAPPSIGTSVNPVPNVIITGQPGADLNLNISGYINVGSAVDKKAVGLNIYSPEGYNLNMSNTYSHRDVGYMTVYGYGNLTVTATPSKDNSSANTITFLPSSVWPLTFVTDATLNASAPNQAIVIGGPLGGLMGAAVEGESKLTLNTNVLVCPGVLVGAPLVFNPTGIGTLTNDFGINAKLPYGSALNLAKALPAGIQTNGHSLAIVSGSDIISGGTITIDLSGIAPNQAGGTLTMLAGMRPFIGTASTKFPAPGFYSDFRLNPAGGKIDIPGVTIITSSNGGSAGNVNIAAKGSVKLGAIDASGGMAGEVQILGDGVTVKSITATGTIKGGLVTIYSATPDLVEGQYPNVTTHSLSITDGIFYGGRVLPLNSQGDISFGTINAGTGTVALSTGFIGKFIQAAGTFITCDTLSAVNGTGNIDLRVNISNLILPFLGFSGGTSGGKISITSQIPVNVIGSTSPVPYSAISFTLDAPAGIDLTSGKAAFGTLTLNSSTGPISFTGGSFSATTLSVTNTSPSFPVVVTGGSVLNGKSMTLAGTAGVHISSIGGSGAKLSGETISLSSKQGQVKLGDLTQLSATKTLTVKGAGIEFGSNVSMSAGGALAGPSKSPLSLTKDMITVPGSLSLTADGAAGITSLGTTQAFTVNGGSMTVTASKGGIAFGDATTINVNGGELEMKAAGGALELGTAGATLPTKSSITVRQLNDSKGSITLSAANGIKIAPFTSTVAGGTLSYTALASALNQNGVISLGANSSSQAHNAVTLKVLGKAGDLNFADSASMSSGVTFAVLGAPSGSGKLTLSSANTINLAKNAKLETFNKSEMNISSTNAFSAGDGTQLLSDGKMTLLSSKGSVTLGAGGSGATVKSLSGTSALTVTGQGLIIDAGSKISAAGAVTLNNNSTSAELRMGISSSVSAGSTGTGGVSINSKGSAAGSSIDMSIKSSVSSNNGDIKISSTNLNGTLSIADLYTLTATGGNIIISSTSTLNQASSAVDISGPIGSVPLSTMTATKVGTKGGSISITAPGQVDLGAGTVNSESIVLTSKAKSVSVAATVISAQTKATITAFTGVTVSTGADISALNSLAISSTGKNSTLTISGNVAPNPGVKLSSGKLSPTAPAQGNLNTLNNDVLIKGSITLKAPLIAISNNGNALTSNGGNLQITATTGLGTVTVGTGNTFTANGGNIQMLAKSNITGSIGNVFDARSMGNPGLPASSIGGGLEIGSGITSSTGVTSALNSKPQPAPPASSLASNPAMLTINLAQGVIKVNNKSGTIDLTAGNNAATLNLPAVGAGPQGGAQVFNALGGTSIQFSGGTFNTAGLKPISMVTAVSVDASDEPSTLKLDAICGGTAVAVGDTPALLNMSRDGDGQSVLIAHPGQSTRMPNSGQSVLMASSEHHRRSAKLFASPRSRFIHKEDGVLHLNKGELFVDATSPVELRTESATVLAKQGALFSLKTRQGNTYVKACSGLGLVMVKVDGATIRLNAGEELLLTAHKPDDSDLRPSDGIGRRHTKSTRMGEHYVTVSEFAIITMLSNSNAATLLQPSNKSENKKLIARLLKSAATVDTVLRARGPYEASAN